jgi:hypothetical protein
MAPPARPRSWSAFGSASRRSAVGVRSWRGSASSSSRTATARCTRLANSPSNYLAGTCHRTRFRRRNPDTTRTLSARVRARRARLPVTCLSRPATNRHERPRTPTNGATPRARYDRGTTEAHAALGGKRRPAEPVTPTSRRRRGTSTWRVRPSARRRRCSRRGCSGRKAGRSCSRVAEPDNGEPRRGGAFRCKGAVSAAGVGFEPTSRLATANGFQDRPVRPLRHPAGTRIVATCRA